jgi:hypothetical protein
MDNGFIYYVAIIATLCFMVWNMAVHLDRIEEMCAVAIVEVGNEDEPTQKSEWKGAAPRSPWYR